MTDEKLSKDAAAFHEAEDCECPTCKKHGPPPVSGKVRAVGGMVIRSQGRSIR